MTYLLNEFRFYIAELVRHYKETIFSLLFYIGLISTVVYFKRPYFDENATQALGSVFLWSVFVGIFSSIVMSIKNDLQCGVFENILTMPVSYKKILIYRVAARFPYDIGLSLVVVLSLLVIFDFGVLNFSALKDIIFILILSIPAVIGISLFYASFVVFSGRAEVAIILGNITLALAVYYHNSVSYIYSPIFNFDSYLISSLKTCILFFLGLFFFNLSGKIFFRKGWTPRS